MIILYQTAQPNYNLITSSHDRSSLGNSIHDNIPRQLPLDKTFLYKILPMTNYTMQHIPWYVMAGKHTEDSPSLTLDNRPYDISTPWYFIPWKYFLGQPTLWQKLLSWQCQPGQLISDSPHDNNCCQAPMKMSTSIFSQLGHFVTLQLGEMSSTVYVNIPEWEWNLVTKMSNDC